VNGAYLCRACLRLDDVWFGLAPSCCQEQLSVVKTCDRAQLSRLTNLHIHIDLILLFINHALFSAFTADESRLSLGMRA
jgi:hypothetical protein